MTVKLKKSHYEYVNDSINHVIVYHGESFRFERAMTDNYIAKRKLREGYGKKGFKLYYKPMKGNKKVILVYISELRHPELIKYPS